MLVGVAELLGRPGFSIPVSIEDQVNGTWDHLDVVRFLQPVKIEGTLVNEDDIFVLEANGVAKISMRCDRCLALVVKEICFELKERFTHIGREKKESETFSGGQIDLTDVVKRSIVGELPMKCICRQDCKGLCSICGTDLNKGDCQCDTTVRDPRFEGLMALFNNNEEV